MPTYRKIWSAEWIANPEDDTKAHGQGTVSVYYSNGRCDEFNGVDRGEFFVWETRGFDWRYPPNNVQTREPEIVPEQEDVEAEIQEQADLEYQNRRNRRLRMFALADNALRGKYAIR